MIKAYYISRSFVFAANDETNLSVRLDLTSNLSS